MRYYELIITPELVKSPDATEGALKTGNNAVSATKPKPPIKFTSLDSKNLPNLNALQIEFDIPIAAMDMPANGGAMIKISGIDFSYINQVTDLNGSLIELYAGMSKGLPLANYEQSGLIMTGRIWQTFGNWQGENITLDLVVMPVGNYAGNYAFNWTAGEIMTAMIERVLKLNHPSYQVKSSVNQNLILSATQSGFYYNLSQFACYCRDASKSIITKDEYNGVAITVKNDTFVITDGSSSKKPMAIQFVNLIGQPTWLNFGTIQLKLSLRADLHIGDIITIPESFIKLTNKSMQGFTKDKTAFNGNFTISSIRHTGNFRQPDANSWVTVVDCLQNQAIA